MTKDVLISVKGFQYLVDDDGSQESIEMVTNGTYYKKPDASYLIYEEATEGFEATTHNMVKFSGSWLEVRKRGLIDVHMVFEPNKRNISYYATPYGMFQMSIAATDVQVTEREEEIRIEAGYALEMNEQLIGDCEICIEVRPRI